MEHTPEEEEAQSFSKLTAELIEQAARLAGARISAPIRAAGSTAARGLMLAACVAGTLTVGMVFLGIAISLLVGMAPEMYRWWICLMVALTFFLAAAILALFVSRRQPKGKTRGPSESE